MEKIYDVEIEGEPATAKDYNPKAGVKYLKSLPESERKSILGVKGNEKFLDNPKAWTKDFKDLSTQVNKKAIIPESKLYGGK